MSYRTWGSSTSLSTALAQQHGPIRPRIAQAALISLAVGPKAHVLELFTELAFGPARLVVRGYQAPQKPPPPRG